MDFISKNEVPPVLYVAAGDRQTEGLATIKVVRLDDGAVAIAAYSSLDRLHEAVSPDSAWMLLQTEQLVQRAEVTGITTIMVDPWLRGLPEGV